VPSCKAKDVSNLITCTVWASQLVFMFQDPSLIASADEKRVKKLFVDIGEFAALITFKKHDKTHRVNGIQLMSVESRHVYNGQYCPTVTNVGSFSATAGTPSLVAASFDIKLSALKVKRESIVISKKKILLQPVPALAVSQTGVAGLSEINRERNSIARDDGCIKMMPSVNCMLVNLGSTS
jgi:hypothetical protein